MTKAELKKLFSDEEMRRIEESGLHDVMPRGAERTMLMRIIRRLVDEGELPKAKRKTVTVQTSVQNV